MLQTFSPISFKKAEPLEISRKFIGNNGKNLNIKINASSNAEKSYKFSMLIHDGKKNLECYSSDLPPGVVKSLAEYLEDVFHEINKLNRFFKENEVKDSENVIQRLIKFFGEAGENV